MGIQKMDSNTNENKQEVKAEEVKPEETKPEEKKPEEEVDPNLPIGGMVNQEHAATLISMGYSKNVSEKSLFLSKNNFDSAMEWIYMNQGEPDFEEELFMALGGKPKSNLSEEEQYAKAKELQERARKMMKEREEENERLGAMKRIEENKKHMENKELHQKNMDKQYIE